MWGSVVELSVRVTRKCVTDCISAHRGKQNDIQRLWAKSGGEISWRGLEQLTIVIIPASCTPTATASVFWEATLGPALSCSAAVCYPGSTGRFWCLMWNEVDLIWGKDSDTLVLQLSQERNESGVCVCVCLCVCVWHVCVSGGSGKWLVINTSDTPGLPSTFHSRVFCGLVTFSFPLVHILEQCLHLWECLLLNFQQVQDFNTDITNVCQCIHRDWDTQLSHMYDV